MRNQLISLLPEEHVLLHEVMDWVLPLHDDPPFSASVAMVRVLILKPVPQVTLQSESLDHEAHKQSTEICEKPGSIRLIKKYEAKL